MNVFNLFLGMNLFSPLLIFFF
uniref:Uncharacterized protein n=1 Tax=Anguilla anguilla TaxID=7936 RepID=A0A0E9PGM8_ANGAN